MVAGEAVPHVRHNLVSPKEAPIHAAQAGLCGLLLLEAHSDNTLGVGRKHAHLRQQQQQGVSAGGMTEFGFAP
jgi:hypothetical protein